MSTSHLSRRALLGAAPLVGLAGVLSAPSIAASLQISPALVTALAALHIARDAAAAGHAAFEPIEEAYFAARESVPHVETRNTFTNIHGDPVSLTTANPGSLASAARVLADMESRPGGPRPEDEDYVATARELRDATEARNSEIERRTQATGYPAAERRKDALCEAHDRALSAMIATPALHLGDLLAKVEEIELEFAWDLGDTTAQIVADIRRLAGAA